MQLTKEAVAAGIALGNEFFSPLYVRDLADALGVSVPTMLQCIVANRQSFVLKGMEIKGLIDDAVNSALLNSNEILQWFMDDRKTDKDHLIPAFNSGEIAPQLGHGFAFDFTFDLLVLPHYTYNVDGTDIKDQISKSYGPDIAQALRKFGTKKVQKTANEQVGSDQYLYAAVYTPEVHKAIEAKGKFVYRYEWALKDKSSRILWRTIESTGGGSDPSAGIVFALSNVIASLGNIQAVLEKNASELQESINATVGDFTGQFLNLGEAIKNIATASEPLVLGAAAPAPAAINPPFPGPQATTPPPQTPPETVHPGEMRRRRTNVELAATARRYAQEIANLGGTTEEVESICGPDVAFKDAEKNYEKLRVKYTIKAPASATDIKKDILKRAKEEGSQADPAPITPVAPAPAPVAFQPPGMPQAIEVIAPLAPTPAPAVPVAPAAPTPIAPASAAASTLLSSLLNAAAGKKG